MDCGRKTVLKHNQNVIFRECINRINSWRSVQDPWLVSLLEEACAPLMKLMGYNLVNEPGHINRNDSKPLITKEIPLFKDLPFNKC